MLLFQPKTAVSSGRLQSTGSGDLTAVITLTFDSKTQAVIPALDVTIEAKNGTDDAVTKGYIVNPENKSLTYNDFKGSEGSWTYDLTLEWSWGAEFGNTDPCAYYNSGAGSETEGATMLAELEDFKTAVAATTFTVNIEPKA